MLSEEQRRQRHLTIGRSLLALFVRDRRFSHIVLCQQVAVQTSHQLFGGTRSTLYRTLGVAFCIVLGRTLNTDRGATLFAQVFLVGHDPEVQIRLCALWKAGEDILLPDEVDDG